MIFNSKNKEMLLDIIPKLSQKVIINNDIDIKIIINSLFEVTN